MSEEMAGTVLRRLVMQLLVTEALSFCFFFSLVRSATWTSANLARWGLMAPISLVFIPLLAFQSGDYTAGGQILLEDIVFVAVLALSIIKCWKWVGGFSLLIFNLVISSYSQET
jgi:hypothetical protein